jgi:hypothetical protein
VLAVVRFAFEDAGIEFIGERNQGLGVKLRLSHAGLGFAGYRRAKRPPPARVAAR